MGLSEEDQKRSQELRLQLNGGIDVGRTTKESQIDKIGTAVSGSQVEVMDCCQANGSSPCCQDPPLLEETVNPDLNERETKLTAEKNKSSKKQMSHNNSGKLACHKVCAMPTWFESWEREDTYVALAVTGAAVSVAFAYSCYKWLR